MNIHWRRLSSSILSLLLLSLAVSARQAEGRRPIRHDGPISSAAFNSDGQTIVSGGLDGKIIFWNASTGAATGIIETGVPFVYAVAFSPDGKMLVAGCANGLVNTYDAGSRHLLRTLSDSGADVETLAFSADGSLLASGDDDGIIKLWDVKSGRELRSFKAGDSLLSVAISQDNRTLASAGGESFIRLREIETGREERLTTGCDSCYFYSVAFSPDGKTLASGEHGSGGYFSRPLQQTGKAAGDERGPAAHHLLHHPVKNPEFFVTLWDVRKGAPRQLLKGHDSFVSTLAFSPDGKLLASGGFDNQVRLWNAQTGEPLKTLTGHGSYVQSVSFSPDGKLLASASGNYQNPDRAIILWNADTGESLRRMDVDGSAFAPYGVDRDSPNGVKTVSDGGLGPGRGHQTGGGIGPGTSQAANPPPVDYNRIFTPKEVTTKARILARPEPQYPEKARINQVSGTVVMRGILASTGEVKGLRILSALPYGLTGRALKAARGIKFIPALKDNHSVSQYIQIEYNFNLY